MAMISDLGTLRRIPWLPGTALVTADLRWIDGEPVIASPRQILRTQLERLAERGLVPYVATELEFIVFDDTYREAWAKGYNGLTKASDYNIDYVLLGSTEGVKGECNFGQQEIGFRYDTALTTCDNHSVYKNGAKEIADAHGKSLTFMAKFNEREGNSCHIHISLRGEDGPPVFADTAGEHGMSAMFRHFHAGQLVAMRALTLLFAPNINSYKRYAEGSFAPTAVAWGLDNRTCSLRVVGQGLGMRIENRVPGGNVNQYLAVAALIAAGLHGIENELELEDAVVGNAYTGKAPRVPSTLREAADLFSQSQIARSAFGDEIVDHYVNYANVELSACDAAVTDWERVRGFERL
jgi:glutamine synthetase